jgi:GNAT superfamily N-acetyltransferase
VDGATGTGSSPLELRVAAASDAPAILELYRRLTAQSRLLRFSGVLPDALLTRAAAIDPSVDHVVLAVEGTRVLGEARMHPQPDGAHEIALTIADDAQGRGIGSALLERLRAGARDRGVVTLRASVRLDNRHMLTMLQRVGAALVRASDGEAVFDIASDERMPGWPVGGGEQRVLVEAPGGREHPITTSLREAGYAVRQCGGPGRGRRDPCPLLSTGHCRLAEEADLILCLLPGTGAHDRAVAEAHAADRPDRLWGDAAP